MLWIKALHTIFMITWFAGLFYLPRLFVYHAMSNDEISNTRFKIMERKLFWGIMTPGALLTFISGAILLYAYAWAMYKEFMWLHIKLGTVILLIIYHAVCLKYLLDFKHNRNTRSHVYYRWFNEVPTIFLFIIVIMVIVKPI